jgi:hypothetical protein
VPSRPPARKPATDRRVIVTAMRRVLMFLVALAACGGPDVPQHNGYKTTAAKPWKKAKPLKFELKNGALEAKSEGDLSYPDMRRAAWFDVNMEKPGELDFRVDVTPPGDAVNDNFDLGFEVLDPANRKVIRKDSEEGDQQNEDKKTAELKELPPGHYMVHLYLQGRLDTCDYALHAVMKPGVLTASKSDFPAQVPFPLPLPMVPVNDDTPKNYKPPTTAPVVVIHHHGPEPKATPPPPTVQTLSARIISIQVVSGGTQITVGRGTSNGAQAGMNGKITGIGNGDFKLTACNERTCTATVAATPDQIKGSGNVVLTP